MKQEEHKEPSWSPTASPGTHEAIISTLSGAWQWMKGSSSPPRTRTAPPTPVAGGFSTPTAPATPVAGGPAPRSTPTYDAWAQALVTLIAFISSDSQDAAGDAGDPGLRAHTLSRTAHTKTHPRRRIRLASSSARNTCAASGHGCPKTPLPNIDLGVRITMGTTLPSPAPTRL